MPKFLFIISIFFLVSSGHANAQEYRGIASDSFGNWSSSVGPNLNTAKRRARIDCERTRGNPCPITTGSYRSDFFVLVYCRNNQYQNAFLDWSDRDHADAYHFAMKTARKLGFKRQQCKVIKDW